MYSYLLILSTLVISIAGLRSGSGAYDSTSDGFGKCETPPHTHAQWAAIGRPIFDFDLCEQCVKVTNPATGASTVANVVDQCYGCGPGDLVLNVPAFSAIANLDKGRIPIEWDFVPCA